MDLARQACTRQRTTAGTDTYTRTKTTTAARDPINTAIDRSIDQTKHLRVGRPRSIEIDGQRPPESMRIRPTAAVGFHPTSASRHSLLGDHVCALLRGSEGHFRKEKCWHSDRRSIDQNQMVALLLLFSPGLYISNTIPKSQPNAPLMRRLAFLLLPSPPARARACR